MQKITKANNLSGFEIPLVSITHSKEFTLCTVHQREQNVTWMKVCTQEIAVVSYN